VPLDLLEQADPLDSGRGSEVGPQEPQAGESLLIDQAVDLSGYGCVIRSARAHLETMICPAGAGSAVRHTPPTPATLSRPQVEGGYMRRLVTGSLISLLACAQLASTSLAQDVSPSPVAPAVSAAAADPMPYADYVAALKAFTTSDPFAGVSDPPTTDELVVAFETLVAKATAEQERLDAVVPEDCYAEAHAELLTYWASSTELTGQLATGLAAGASLDALGSMVNEMDAELFARHPIAYAESTDPSGGFRGSPFNILTALSTCDIAAGESMAPEPTAEASPAS
jgi:hypothetical protein